MICYMDRTFCDSENCTNECGRQLTDEIKAGAKKWWGKEGAPIAVGKFCEEIKSPSVDVDKDDNSNNGRI